MGSSDQFDYIYWEDVGSLLQKDIPKVTDESVDSHSRDLFPYNQVSDILPYFHALPKLNKKRLENVSLKHYGARLISFQLF